ncbi:MAG: nicotinate-nucleotide--dimethylbenzimidazole phosphoribosyltransferase [Candidatus Aureabacteria bacterium]|nr:nicotinate-nucleotide--dimethylbenzimidazole phosphoribosyltransferase [Candidatus Auribacterota bacterium]
MRHMNKTIQRISPVKAVWLNKAQERLDKLTKPLGSLGQLEELAKQLVAITEKEKPVLHHKIIFTFIADHGVAEEGISAYPQIVTAQMAANFLNKGAAVNVLADHAGARLVAADLGVAVDLPPHPKLISKKIAYGTKNMMRETAMTRTEAIESIETGIEIFQQEFKKGIDIAGIGEMGIGNTTASSAITAVITKQAVEAITGRGTGINDKILERKIRIIKESLTRHLIDPTDPVDILSKVGGFEIGGMTGVMLAAASKKIPIMLDGFISGASALLAVLFEPNVRDYLIASHRSQEKGHAVILDHLGLRPLLDLNLRLGEGTGSALAMNLADASVKILTHMATFESAGVSEKTT